MKKKFFIIFGTLLSIILLIIVFSHLDWSAFFAAFKNIKIPQILLAGGIIMLIVALRALRWTLITCIPLTKFKHFWQAVNIGYLGNMVYPARAGEVLKIIAIHHFVPLTWGRAITTAVIDRMFDMIVLGIFTVLVFWIHGHRIDHNLGKSIIIIFILAVFILIFLIFLANTLHNYVQRWTPQSQWQRRLQELILHAIEGIQALQQTHHILTISLVAILIFLLDYFWMWQIMGAFGWDLPFEAALTVGVFLLLSISLPSAPGYIGIYQIACVLALSLYDIDQASAVAYSIVIQLLTFAITGVQGMLVTIYCGFNLSQERQQVLPK